MNSKRIPFNKPFFIGKELEYIYEAIHSNSNISGNGPFTNKCHRWLENNLDVKKALLTKYKKYKAYLMEKERG